MKVFQFNPGTRALVFTLTALVYLFVFAPVLFVIYGSFDANEILRFPYEGFSLRWYSSCSRARCFTWPRRTASSSPRAPV